VSEEVIASTIPTTLALKPIRNKYTAHRQIDPPRDDDCQNQELQQHGLVFPIGKPEQTRITYDFPTKQRDPLLKKYQSKPVASIEVSKDNTSIIFTPTRIHQVIIKEIIKLLEQFFGIPS